MQAAVDARAAQAEVIVMAAAVADFRPADPAGHKLKKDEGVPTVVLEPTPDILGALGASKPPGQILVGFAAETDRVAENAQRKLARKNLDLIVANDVSAPGVGFDHDTNAVTIFSSGGEVRNVPLAEKATIARAVLDEVVACRHRRFLDHSEEQP
jgi:phosphopantothenoylcysteine decarboxylase/phosphopantothenate--cysteine ligase